MKQAGVLEQIRTRLPSLNLHGGYSWRLVLLIAFLNGLLYFVVIPPWWHYDEPGHFEYAWLVANRADWPKAGDHDEAMRREMAQSMERYGWYALRNYKLNLSSGNPVWIGATQTGGRPAYYFVASLPLRLVRGTDILVQYDLARLTSFLLYLLTILMIWKAMGELLHDGHPLQWIVSGFIALLPAFTDTMVSVSDDVGAIAVSCLFLWLSIRLVKRGSSLTRLVMWGIPLVLCYLTKNTAWFTFLLAPFILLFSLLKGRSVWLAWGATPIVILIGVLVLFERGGAASWYQDRTQTPSFRIKTPSAVLGKYAFQLDYSGERQPQQTGQFLSQELIRSLRGKTVTLGAWIWADQGVQVDIPSIRFATEHGGLLPSPTVSVQVQQTPSFEQTTIEVPADATYAVVLPPYSSLGGRKVMLFFDGAVLTEGAYAGGPPQFSDASAKQGSWNGRPFINLIDNGSAEQGALRVRPAIDAKTVRLLAHVGSLSAMFSILGDWQGTTWYYRDAFDTMFRTFWASVAADKFNLPGTAPNDFLLLLTVVGLLGTARLAWRKRRELRWDIMYVLLATVVLVWSFTILRGIHTLLLAGPTFPWSRYAFPAILPTALLICAGWAEWLGLLGERFSLSDEVVRLVPIGMMAGLSAYTLLNIVEYFHPSVASRAWLFWLAGLLLLAFMVLRWRAQRLRASV